MPITVGTLEHFEDYLSSFGERSRFFRSPVVSSLVIATSSVEFVDNRLKTIAFPFILDSMFTETMRIDLKDEWVITEPHLQAREVSVAVTSAVQQTGQYRLINADWPKLTGEQRYMEELTLGAVEAVVAWHKSRPVEAPPVAIKPKAPLLIERGPNWGGFSE